MAALKGDLYNMYLSSKEKSQQVIDLKNSLSTQPIAEDKKSNTSVGMTINPTISITDNDTNKNELFDAEQNANPLALLDLAQNQVRVWLGDDYRFSQEETDSIQLLASTSEDPLDAVTRFVAARGINNLTGMDIDVAYKNLDQISEFWEGSEFNSRKLTLGEKFQNAVKADNLRYKKYEWMIADVYGNTERAKVLEQEIMQEEAELGDRMSALPTGLIDKYVTLAINQLPYFAKPAIDAATWSVGTYTVLTALASTLNPIAGLGASAAVGAFSAAAGKVGSMKAIGDSERGDSYWDYMHNYDEKNKTSAFILSNIKGLTTAVIETFLDGVASRGVNAVTKAFGKNDVTTIGLNALIRLDKKGSVSRISSALIDWITGGVDEGVFNELPEYIISEAMDALYMNANDIDNPKKMADRIEEVKDTVWQGTVIGLIYGAIGVPFEIANNRSLSMELRRKANNSESFTDFVKKTNSIEKPETVSQEEWDKIREAVFKRAEEDKQSLVNGAVLESEGIAQEELYTTYDKETDEEKGIVPDGSVYRTEEGNLYNQIQSDSNSDRVYFGDPDSKAVYGYVELSSDGAKQTVREVRVRPGYENIRAEMVSDAIHETNAGELEIEWNPKTPGLQRVKELAFSADGLNVRTQENETRIATIANQIKSTLPSISNEEAVLAARLTTLAEQGNPTTTIASAQNMTKEELQGKALEKIKGASSSAKGLIYAANNADMSTFVHELFHVTTGLRETESKQLSKAIREEFANEVSKNQLRKFVEDHIEIWGKKATVDNVMDILNSINENNKWSITQEENLARLWEAYRSSKSSISSKLPSGLRRILEKISKWMNRVYTAIKDTISLNDSIATAFDNLMGINKENFNATEEFYGLASSNNVGSPTYQEAVNKIDDLKSINNEDSMAPQTTVYDERPINTDLTEDDVEWLKRHENDVRFQTIVPNTLEEEIDNISEKDIGKPNETITFSNTTPAVFRSLGMPNLSIEMYKDKLAKSLYLDRTEKHGHKDSIDKTIVKNVSDKLANPIAVFDSATVKGSLVALYDIEDNNGNWVMASLSSNKEKNNKIIINLITSLYGKDSEKVYAKWVNRGLLRYVNDEKIKELSDRLQLPSASSFINNRVLSKSDIVNDNKVLFQLEDDYIDWIETLDEEENGAKIAEDLNGNNFTEIPLDVDSSAYDWEIPDDWDRVYGKTLAEIERDLREEAPELAPEEINKLFSENGTNETENEKPYLQGERDLTMTFPEFVELNKPDITYEGTEAQKDQTFIDAIKNDDKVLRSYMGILGEVLLHETPDTNVSYVENYDSKWKRTIQERQVFPYVDDAYRSSLRARALQQIQDKDVRRGARVALKGSPWAKGFRNKLVKVLSENARFYRNILGWIMTDENILPQSFTDEKGLDIPDIDTMRTMQPQEIAVILREAKNEAAVKKFLAGNLKFAGDIDEEQYKAVTQAIKDMQQELNANQKELKEQDRLLNEQEDKFNKLEKTTEKQKDSMFQAQKILDSVASALSLKKTEFENDRSKKIAIDLSKLNDLNSEEQYQKDNTVKGSRDKGIAIGQKLGTQKYMIDMAALYPALFRYTDENGEEQLLIYSPSKNTKDNAQIRNNIENEKAKLQQEIIDNTLKQFETITRRLSFKEGLLSSSLDAINSLLKGDTTAVNTEEYTNLKESEKDLQKAVNKAKRMINNRDVKISDLKSLSSDLNRELKKTQTALEKTHDKYENLKESSKKKIEDIREKNKKKEKELKKAMAEKRKEEHSLAKIRKIKTSLANRIMAKVNLNTTDYDTTVQSVTAIQALIDPAFRRDWVRDLESNPIQENVAGAPTMTIEQAKKYINGLTDEEKTDLFSYMPQDLILRLTEQKKPLNDWTLQELQTMADAIDDIKRRGREVYAAKKTVKKEQEIAVQRAIINSVGISDNNSLPGSTERLAESRKFSKKLQSAMYKTRRMQELAQLLDGGYGNKGAAYRLLVTEQRFHRNREQNAIEKRFNKVKPYLDKKAMNELTQSVDITFKDGKKMNLTIDELAYILLSEGNEQNKAAVAYGALVDEYEKGSLIDKGQEFIDPKTGEVRRTPIFLVNTPSLIRDDAELERIGMERYNTALEIAKKEIANRGLTDLVKAIGDDFSLDENFNRLNRASIEYFNRPVERQERYLPIHRTDMRGKSFDNVTADSIFNLNTNSLNQQVNKGSTKERITISPRNQKNIDKSLIGVWQSAVKEQEHLIEYAGYVNKLRNIFQGYRSKELMRAIDTRYSKGLNDEIASYIDLIASPETRGSRNDNDLNKIFKFIRGKTGAAYLGWKLSGIVLQAITSPGPALSELGPIHFFKGYLKLGIHPKETLDFVMSRSTMMRNRTMNPIIDEAIKRRNQWGQNKFNRAINKFEEVGQLGLEWVDKMAVSGQWIAMYDKVLNEELNNGTDTVTAEVRAIDRADDFVLRTQPTGEVTELASMFRSKNEAVKTILQFQTSLNVIWNNLTANLVGMARNRAFAQIIGTITGYSVAGLILGLVQEGLDEDDDTKDKVLKSFYWSLTQGLDSVPLFGSQVDGLFKKILTGESDFYNNNGISISPPLDKLIQAFGAASNAKWDKAASRGAEAIGIITGLPTSGTKQLYNAIKDKTLWPLLGR